MPENMQENNIPQNGQSRLTTGLVVSILVISLLAGALSGALATVYFLKSGGSPALVTQNLAKKILVEENSAVIDVVQKASPAVVSIVVSKNIDQLQSERDIFSQPFFFDPFFRIRPSPPSPQKDSAPKFQEVGAGTGFFVKADGTIVTNRHVVADEQAKYTVYTSDGKKYDAKVLARDPINDIAILKIAISNAPYLNLADSSKLQIGQKAIAIGNSLGQYRNTVTTGIISGIGRNIVAGSQQGTSEQLEGLIQTDAAINLGNSGGPLLNIDAQVIGINTAIDQQGQLVGFAIPSLDISRDLQSFEKFGSIKKPFLGVRYVLITPAIKEQFKLPVDAGAWLSTVLNGQDNSSAVVAGAAADKAGLKDNDIILSVDGVKIDQNTTLASLIKKYNPGDKMSLEVLRSGKSMKISVTLGEK